MRRYELRVAGGTLRSAFEELVAEKAVLQHGVAICSGTAGLHAALTAMGVSHDNLVFVPAFTFIATPNAVAHCGASPWLRAQRADLNPGPGAAGRSLRA